MRALALLLVAACSSGDPPVKLAFSADPGPPGSEEYLCFGFDAALLGGADIGAMSLDAPAGVVTLHHVSLYAATSDFPPGPVECETMPADAVSLHVWALGMGDLALDPDLAIAVPPGTTHLIVQAHALRSDDGPAASGEVVIETRRDPMHLAAWLPLRVPTPAIGPHERISSSSSCAIAEPLHVISVWPHMHRIGVEFHGLVDVVPFTYDTQHAYPVSIDVAGGESIASMCTWENPTDATVLPGPKLSDEKCEQALIAWPVEAAHCE